MAGEQRVIIKFLTNEFVDAREIRMRLSAQFGEQIYALLHDGHPSVRPAFDYIDTKIISILKKAPFESARSIAQVLNVNHATLLHYLHEMFEFKSYCLRWWPHTLTGERKAKSKELMVPMISD
jgi:hypothetical protein